MNGVQPSEDFGPRCDGKAPPRRPPHHRPVLARLFRSRCSVYDAAIAAKMMPLNPINVMSSVW
jgi:hypothetical protein